MVVKILPADPKTIWLMISLVLNNRSLLDYMYGMYHCGKTDVIFGDLDLLSRSPYFHDHHP